MKTPYLNAGFLVVFIILFFGACKKNSDDPPPPVTISLIETGLQEEFIRWSADDTTVHNVRAKMTGEAWVNPNSMISLTVDPSILPGGSGFELLPDSTYSLDSANAVIATGEGEAQLPIYFFTQKIDPYTKYVLPLRLQPGDLELDPSANTVLLRVLLGNDYTGLYADTITSATSFPPPDPYGPAHNFTDSLVHKTLTAVNDSTVVMDFGVPGMFAGELLTMHIQADSSILLVPNSGSTGDLLQFALANVNVQPRPRYEPIRKYFYIPYYYYDQYFFIRERLKKIN